MCRSILPLTLLVLGVLVLAFGFGLYAITTPSGRWPNRFTGPFPCTERFFNHPQFYGFTPPPIYNIPLQNVTVVPINPGFVLNITAINVTDIDATAINITSLYNGTQFYFQNSTQLFIIFSNSSSLELPFNSSRLFPHPKPNPGITRVPPDFMQPRRFSSIHPFARMAFLLIVLGVVLLAAALLIFLAETAQTKPSPQTKQQFFCTKCGKKLPQPAENFCPFCGIPLDKEKS